MSGASIAGLGYDACGSAHVGVAFAFQTRAGTVVRCWRCAMRHRPMLRRSLRIALVVGTLLLAINQGDVLVPFVVATWGALVNSRVRSHQIQ